MSLKATEFQVPKKLRSLPFRLERKGRDSPTRCGGSNANRLPFLAYLQKCAKSCIICS